MEKIDLHIGYGHNWFDHPLTISLKVNDRVINFDVSGKEYVEINKTIKLPAGKNRLTLEISNKTEIQTTIDAQGKILRNTIVDLKSFSLDGINLIQMITTDSDVCKFLVNNDQHQILYKITEFGHNGTWHFDFKTPMYDWLLQKLF